MLGRLSRAVAAPIATTSANAGSRSATIRSRLKRSTRWLLVGASALVLVVVSGRKVGAQTFTDTIWECLNEAADAFYDCVMGAQDEGWIKRNLLEFACAVTYEIDGVACLPISVVDAATKPN
jgi:hypothetical protein